MPFIFVWTVETDDRDDRYKRFKLLIVTFTSDANASSRFTWIQIQFSLYFDLLNILTFFQTNKNTNNLFEFLKVFLKDLFNIK